jgi:class 3 adenylate cyclase
MFSDLVGSTALSARMDPEDLREVISAYQKCVAETVQRFGGFVAKYMGDGVLVYFGYSQAHEDDAERAVRAGLELIQAIGGLKSSASLQTRVGIATGLVVVGDLIGSGEAQERGIVGETPNIAARLQSIAEPNTVVIADSTRKLLGNLFELKDRKQQELKGIDGTARAFVALRPSMVESRFEALRIATTPMVGRGEEMVLLARRWEQAKAGEGQIVLVSGEPGIGKCRLAQTLVERLAGEPHFRLRFFCSPHNQDSALYPVIAHLERAAGFRREDNAEQRLDKLEVLLAQATNDLGSVAPLIADLLSIPFRDRYPALELTPQKRKEKTLAALTSQIEGLSAREPVLMVYEDLHWSDPTTRESVDLLIDRLSKRRILAIITFRPEFSPQWIGLPNVTMLTLNRLAPRQRSEMIAHVTGGKTLPKEISNQIVERTDGVPLFIEELTKSVVESELVTDAGDHYAVTGPAVPLAIPTTLHASLLARLDRLAPTREVAQIGAALARSFSHELISAVAQMSQHKLDEALEQLVAAELISGAELHPTPSICSSTLWCRTPPTAPYCAAADSSCTPESPRRWRAGSPRAQQLNRPSWRTIAPKQGSARRRSPTGSRRASRRWRVLRRRKPCHSCKRDWTCWAAFLRIPGACNRNSTCKLRLIRRWSQRKAIRPRLWVRPSSGHKRSPNSLIDRTMSFHFSVHNGFST